MIFLISLLFQFASFFYWGIKNSPRKHFVYLYTLVIYFIYIFLGPLNEFHIGDYMKFGANFSDYYDFTLILYNIAIFFYSLSYIYIYQKVKLNINDLRKKRNWEISKLYNVFLTIFFLCVSYIIFRRVNLDDTGLQFTGGWMNYLVFMADSLIITFIIIISEKKLKIWHIVFIAITLIFYLILGFRYRIILLLLGIFYHIFITNKIDFKAVLKWSLYIYIGFFIINFISINRNSFRELNISDIRVTSKSPFDLTPYQYFMFQTSNYRTDMVVITYMKNNITIEHDFGESMFLNIFYRITPASIFENNTKPNIPHYDIIRNSFGSSEGYFSGSAVTNIIEYYIAGGIFGIIFFMSLLGGILARISKKTLLQYSRDRVFVVIMLMFLFQELTRGYFPQSFTLLCFLFLAYILLYKKSNHVITGN